MREGIARINQAIGVEPGAYHETVTRFYLTLIHDLLRRVDSGQPDAELVNAVLPHLGGDRDSRAALWARYYTHPASIWSNTRARRAWVEPDRARLPMAASDRVALLLSDRSAVHEVIEHEAAATAAEVAAARGTPLEMGGKSIVMKLDRGIGFAVLVLGGHRALDNPSLRKNLGARRYRFAAIEELHELTGLTPGCVPPFGRPVFDLPLYVDEATARSVQIAFAAASHTRSIVMGTADWLELAEPTKILPLSRPLQASPTPPG